MFSGPPSWVHSICWCSFCNCCPFLAQFCNLILQECGTTVANLVTLWFIFTILLNKTRRGPVILLVFQSLVISPRTSALWTKHTVHNFGIDIPNLLNCLILSRNTLCLSSHFPLPICLPSSPPALSSPYSSLHLSLIPFLYCFSLFFLPYRFFP